MPITLEELLGKETETKIQNSDTARNGGMAFPPFEEYVSRRTSERFAEPRESERYNVRSRQNGGYGTPRYVDEARDMRDYGAMEEDTYDYARPARQQSFYEFAARDNAVPSEQELYSRLSHTNQSMRPVFDREKQEAKSYAQSERKERTRSRLNTKGKIIVAAFVAAVVTTMSLIIAFAGKINSGTAVMPAASASYSVQVD